MCIFYYIYSLPMPERNKRTSYIKIKPKIQRRVSQVSAKYASWKRQLALSTVRSCRLLKEIERVEQSNDELVTSSILHGIAQSFSKDALLKLLQYDYEAEISHAAATEIQAHYRGYKCRLEFRTSKACIIQRAYRRYRDVKCVFVPKEKCFPEVRYMHWNYGLNTVLTEMLLCYNNTINDRAGSTSAIHSES